MYGSCNAGIPVCGNIAHWSLASESHSRWSPWRRISGSCMTTSLTFSTFSFHTSLSHRWGSCEFHFSHMFSEDTHTHTDWHPQSLHFEMRMGLVSFAHTTGTARGHFGLDGSLATNRFVMCCPVTMASCTFSWADSSSYRRELFPEV